MVLAITACVGAHTLLGACSCTFTFKHTCIHNRPCLYRFLWMWPNARISVMGGEQAANVLYTIKADQARRDKNPQAVAKAAGDKSPQTAGDKDPQAAASDEEKAFKKMHMDNYEKEGHPYYASAR